MMSQPITIGTRIWCPVCKDYTHLLRIRSAARLADVDRRTIYRYIQANKLYAVKVVGTTYRVCNGCLIKADSGG